MAIDSKMLSKMPLKTYILYIHYLYGAFLTQNIVIFNYFF